MSNLVASPEDGLSCDKSNFHFRSMIFCQLVYRFPILLDAATAAVQRKGDKFLLQWAEIMTGTRRGFIDN